MRNEKHKVLKARQTHYKRQMWGYIAEQRLLKEQMSEYLRQDFSFYDYCGMMYTDYCVARNTFKSNSWMLTQLSQKLKDIKNEIKECCREHEKKHPPYYHNEYYFNKEYLNK